MTEDGYRYKYKAKSINCGTIVDSTMTCESVADLAISLQWCGYDLLECEVIKEKDND